MYGEDCSGRKVSLLNDDTSISRTAASSSSSNTTTTANHHDKSAFTRPKLPDRSRFSISSSSVCSSRSWDSYRSSRPSSISCSPRHSPPTPPLARLDSQSSVSTVSPMTPPFTFDPMDQRNLYKNGQSQQQQQQSFFVNAYPPPHAAPGGNPYPPLHDPASQAFYPMAAQQPLPPVYDLNDSFSQQASLGPLQTAALPPYAVNPALNPLSPTHNASIMQSPTTAAPLSTTINPKTSTAQTVTGPAALASGNVPAFANSVTSPAKADTTAPNSATKANAKASSNAGSTAANNNNNNSNANQPKKKYPCPHAKSAGCKDTFTTSGHAARHGKKHTGEKNVACPTCGKTFTRKDNMKQHERTHKNQNASAATAGRTPTDPVSTSPVLTSNTINRRGRAPSSSTLGSGSTLKDFEADSVMIMDTDLDMQPQMLAAGPRPEMRRSKLSEILEQVQATGELDAEGEIDPDAEGESPLDALATIAAGEIVQ